VNTSSSAGVIGFKEEATYVATKHGVVGLTKTAALDYAQSNIRINAVAPGIIGTSMMQRFSGGTLEGREAMISQEPVGRMGQAEEIAAAVIWLYSDAASFSFVTGHTVVVDAGHSVGRSAKN
jgi:NAD(P)-dependent dehydrogenase (short-subunit alcohol dehydrogenase family)